MLWPPPPPPPPLRAHHFTPPSAVSRYLPPAWPCLLCFEVHCLPIVVYCTNMHSPQPSSLCLSWDSWEYLLIELVVPLAMHRVYQKQNSKAKNKKVISRRCFYLSLFGIAPNPRISNSSITSNFPSIARVLIVLTARYAGYIWYGF